MKSLAALCALAFLTLPIRADWVIESKIESPQMNSATVTKVKGDKLRMDIASGPMGAMSSIMDSTTGDSIQLLHGQKMAMTTTGAQLREAMEMAKKSGVAEANAPAAKPVATGQKEKVGGYDCEIWTWTIGPATSKLWIAANHPQAAALMDFAKKMNAGALKGMAGAPDQSLLPGPAVKSETTVNGVTTTATVVGVKEETVAASEFEVPAGYQKMALPAMTPPPAK